MSRKGGTHPATQKLDGPFLNIHDVLNLPIQQADDEMDKPYLEGFEWMPAHHEYTEQEQDQKEADWQRLYVHLTSTPTVASSGGGKKKNKKGAE